MKFHGFLKYDALPDIYAQSDAFVLPALPAINLNSSVSSLPGDGLWPADGSVAGRQPEVVERDELIFTPGDFHELAARLRGYPWLTGTGGELGAALS